MVKNMFTALHRAAGVEPGPLTNEILDSAIAMGAKESADLDWKAQLPPAKDLRGTDFPKDIAAIANSGGGTIVYGVEEAQKAATSRVDAGELSEIHERALRKAAISAITPPIFGLDIVKLEREGQNAIAVVIPASTDGPHLIYRNDLFGAPLRVDADTIWMTERDLEAAYRARFNERRYSEEALDALYSETGAGRDIEKRAWLVAVARPRLPQTGVRLSRDDARSVFQKAEYLAPQYAGTQNTHPLVAVESLNPRPGLRRWVAPYRARNNGQPEWDEAWFSIHNDGAVTLACAVGGHLGDSGGELLPGHEVQSRGIEAAIGDFMAVVRAAAEISQNSEYEFRAGIQFEATEEPLKIITTDGFGRLYRDVSTPMHRFSPVELTFDARAEHRAFYQTVYELATDLINQGGVLHLQLMDTPDSWTSPA